MDMPYIKTTEYRQPDLNPTLILPVLAGSLFEGEGFSLYCINESVYLEKGESNVSKNNLQDAEE